jgi:hypothetical protein
MTKYELTKIAREAGITFKQAIRLIALKGEIAQRAKFEGDTSGGLELNCSMRRKERDSFDALATAGMIELDGEFATVTDKGRELPSIGAIAFLGSFADADVLDRL